MTECDPPKIRSLIEKHLGKDKAKEYDTIVEQCKLGQALKDDRVWAPLCPAYPNLKGVTCEEIERCVGIDEDDIPEYVFTEEHFNMINSLQEFDPDEKLTDEEENILKNKYVKEYVDNVVRNAEYELSVGQMTTINNVAHDLFWTNKDHPTTYDPKYYFDDYYIAEMPNYREKLITGDTFKSDCDFKDKYYRNVRVYDRDEIYAAFKRIGNQIRKDMPRVIKDPSTIYVTTPRGGHEMLSIFTYANDIGKLQIPSDIIGDEDDPDARLGQTWVSHASSEDVKTIFIVDDIIASCQQLIMTTKRLRKAFPNASIHSITLCKRIGSEKNIDLPPDIEYYTDEDTSGIDEFRRRFINDEPTENYVTCLFPHACPDGHSDKLMIELMGDYRCAPEKRISRRDL